MSDIKNVQFYEYGELVKNLQNGNGYSLFYYEKDSLKFQYITGVVPFKSAYMPPGYTAFLYPFFLIHNDVIRNLFVLFLQIILSAINAFILYLITRHLFSEKAGIISALIYAVLPEFIYSSANGNIVVLFHTLILALFYLLVKEKHFSDYKKLAVFILVSVILIYLRFEYILFIILLTIIFFRSFGIKNVGIIYISLLIALSPWLIRNYIVFRQFPLLSTSTGQNLYRGHNKDFVGNWGEDELDAKLKGFKTSPDYEIEANRIYANKAISFIISNPLKEIKYSFQKLYELWVFNNEDKRTESLFYKLPVILILFLFLLGLYRSISVDKFKYFYLFFIFFSFVSVVFFALPRYQTMLKVMIIPFAAQGMIFVYNYLKGKFTM
jgi:4-amino-4-deoxy-L-arabinose transferase-like glycosyltransferase